uniref:BPTI/Kunitz inhibitor domain-containing protein n=1 Tax=Amblyomma maculatum TaxID=34609 RepID=G3MR11_AMBMU
MPVTGGPVYVCNQSPNRFSSLEECRRDCANASRPHRLCMATPQFSHCEKDLAGSWWFSNGTACEEWRFPLGLCPAQGSSVFASAHQCRENCLLPRDKLQCRHRPEPQVCAMEQLTYPYFAVVDDDGSFRCLEASSSTLSGYQCQTGANHFVSVDSCNSTCVHGEH